MRCVGGEKFGRGTRRGYMRSRLLLLATVVSLVVVAPARAGTYDVYSCRLPDGSPAPTNGWTRFATPAPEVVVTTSDGCAAGGGLTASLRPLSAIGVEAGWRFVPPPSITIEGFEIARTAHRPEVSFGAVAGYVASLGIWPPGD